MRKWLMGPVMVAGLVGAGLGVGASALSAFAVTTSQAEKRAETFRQLELFAEIVAKAQSNYVVEFDEGEAIEAAIDGMLASLDPHSSYLDPDDFKDMQAQTSGEYGGLGIEVTAQDGFVKVVAPMDGTPASRAGIKSADFRTWTVRVKPGIHFAEDPAFGGKPRELVAEDYVYSIKRVFDPRWKSQMLFELEPAKILGLDDARQRALKGAPFDYLAPEPGRPTLATCC